MSNKKFCPACQQEVEQDERFCPDCGCEIPEVTPTTISSPEGDASIIGAGARANVTGGVHKTTTNHTNVNTSNVDNSSTVNHNTTYVMNGKQVEYCEVCGNPLKEQHARCPKCGKEICFDCKVKGKNRCVECEKKAINEYRIAFQQSLLTTNGNLGVALRQMMDQKARDLDVEDVKAQIEKELSELYKPAVKPTQPDVAPIAVGTVVSQASDSAKGIGALDGRKAIQPKQKGSSSKIILLLLALVVVAVVVLLLSKGDAPKTQQPTSTEVEQPVETAQPSQASPVKTQPATVSNPVKKNVIEETVETQPAIVEKDANYEIGMKAYEANDGLKAVSAFKKSGSAEAFYMLGVIYESGCGNVSKNAMLARKNFKKAADLGSAKAKAKL